MAIDTATPRNTLAVSPPVQAPRARRSKRTVTLSTKARETQRVDPLSFRDIETVEDEDDEYMGEDENENEAESNGAAILQTLVKLVTALKRTVERQNGTIKNVETQLSEIKAEQQALRTQNGELQDEMRTLRNQLSSFSASLPSSQSWASVVANSRANVSDSRSATHSSLS